MSNNKAEEGMQQKFQNFGVWLVSLVQKHFPEDQQAEITEKITTYFSTEQNYLDVYFSAIPGLVSMEKPKSVILKLRKLKEDAPRKEAIDAILFKARIAKLIIDSLLATPENELDMIVKKFSLYVNLFTDMYLQ